MHPDEIIVRVLIALARVHQDLGPAALDRAARQSLLSIARVRVEVVGRTGTGAEECKVIPFVARSRRVLDAGVDDHSD